METSEYIVNTLKTLVQFTQPFTTRYILGTLLESLQRWGEKTKLDVP